MRQPHKVMSDETVMYFKNNSLVLLSSANKELTPLIREWINVIYKNNNGYILIWPDLAKNLLQLLSTRNYSLSNEIYELIATYSVRYTEELYSDRLIEEILSCMCICDQLFNDMLTIISNIQTLMQNNDSFMYLNILKNCLTICYHFNYQDFPEFFEDNLEKWIQILIVCSNLAISNPYNNNVVAVNIASLKIINMYFNNYFDDVKNYKDNFTEPLWNLLLSVDNFSNSELLIFEIIDYFKIVIMHRILAIDYDKVKVIFNKLVFPNLKLSNKEIEDFQNDEVAFLKSEIEEIEEFSCKYNNLILLY